LFFGRKNKRSGPSGSRYSPNLICSWFLHACSFDQVSFPTTRIWTLCCDFCRALIHETWADTSFSLHLFLNLSPSSV
jgi:hypothetical protein